MSKVKQSAKLSMVMAATLLMTACGTTEYVPVNPECEPAPRAKIDTITSGEAQQMTDTLQKKVFSNTKALINNVKANERIIKSVCKSPK